MDFAYNGNLGKRIKGDLFQFSLPSLLRFEDKNSMAHSVETRLPFLDFRVVEMLASFPLTQKMCNGWTKYVLRNAMKGVLPELIRLRKSKLGFATPENVWFKKEINTQMAGVFEELDFGRNYVKKDKLTNCFNKYINNKSIHQSELFFRFYILELWGRKFL